MSSYELINEGKKYRLEADKCSGFLNDEERPIEGITVEDILDLLRDSERVLFYNTYYDQACESCQKNINEDGKYFDYLEFQFYLFAKGNSYVISSLSEEYDSQILSKHNNTGTVDSTYLISVTVCESCGDYTIDLEYGLF